MSKAKQKCTSPDCKWLAVQETTCPDCGRKLCPRHLAMHSCDKAKLIVRAANAHEALVELRTEVGRFVSWMQDAKTYTARREGFAMGIGGLTLALTKADAALALPERK